MDYTPHTKQDIEEMLKTVGISRIEDLFVQVPEALLLKEDLDLPSPLTEMEVLDHLSSVAARNRSTDALKCFAGGGAYDHYVPAPVRHLAYRSEFSTSYTPYQPELSQGVLGALFEFQTLICELFGMEVSNASLYDGASALVEAVNLATAVTERKRVLVSEALNPNYRSVMETFGAGPGYEFATLPASDGVTQLSSLDDSACVVVSQPNFFGVIEDLKEISERVHEAGALLIVHFDPMSAGVLEAPGLLGADVVTGEGQSLGNELMFGGPYLGLFATKEEHVRRVPGRITGATLDVRGHPGFVLTLQAREQHIRREKANSNVCTNQTLMAIVATVYLSWLGPQGLKELGETCLSRAHHAAELLSSAPGCRLKFDQPFFKEFVLEVSRDANEVAKGLAERGFLIGPNLSAIDGLENCLLVAVTEKRTTEDIEALAKTLAEVAG
jgi:glycine dehydrogenase subunit 1